MSCAHSWWPVRTPTEPTVSVPRSWPPWRRVSVAVVSSSCAFPWWPHFPAGRHIPTVPSSSYTALQRGGGCRHAGGVGGPRQRGGTRAGGGRLARRAATPTGRLSGLQRERRQQPATAQQRRNKKYEQSEPKWGKGQFASVLLFSFSSSAYAPGAPWRSSEPVTTADPEI